jgi:hypothetical protein
MHLGNASYFWFLTRELGNPEAPLGHILMIFPIGMLSLIVPVSVSGLGVGHVLFEQLFNLLNLSGGATVFNVYMVAQLTPCVLGAIPYVMMRAETSAGAKLTRGE